MCEINQWVLNSIAIAFGIVLVAYPIINTINNIRLDRKTEL